MCRHFGTPIDLKEDSCIHFASEIWICDRCGCQFLPPTAIINLNEVLCRDCGKNIGLCVTCKNGKTCEFRNNPDPTPHMIPQTVRQGNMIMQTQVPNPERVARYCHSCECFSKELGCLKETGACEKWS